jgi:hypothetical protein
VETE